MRKPAVRFLGVVVAVVGLSAAGIAGFGLLNGWFSTVPPAPANSTAAGNAMPENSSATPPNPFLNARPAVAYVGSAACIECHADQGRTYKRTAHSLALSDADPAREPADGEFHHAASGRRYRIFRQDGRLWHSEAKLAPDGRTVAELKYPLRYLIGSGRHARSYLIEADGFLVESPITWYSSKSAWGMSPGYDRADHRSFNRPTDAACVVCHAGNIEPLEGTLHRLAIHEQAIGCEQCHGPGDLHRQKQQAAAKLSATADAPAAGAADFTIVNPAHLDRERHEAVCAQCHLRGDATALLPGRNVLSFRPGMTLTEVRIDYRLKTKDASMKVVGHVEQMQLSRCYQQSDSLTCTTCHDPHADTRPQDAAAFFRQKCLECHQPDACGLDEPTRRQRQPQDHCAACHMPQSDTEIPHIAFTHHRIGLHTEAAAEPDRQDQTAGELTPISDVSQLREADRMFCLAMAYQELADKETDAAVRAEYHRRTEALLRGARDRGIGGGEVDALMARLRMDHDANGANLLAHAALHDQHISPTARINALLIFGKAHLKAEEAEPALMAFTELTRLRRNVDDWLLVGQCHRLRRDLNAELAALKKAAEIDPFVPEVHLLLSQVYAAAALEEEAARHHEIAAVLQGGE